MSKNLNAQYNLGRPDSLAIRTANRMRFGMYDMYAATFPPTEGEKVLDVGATSDRNYASSNYFEARYPYKHQVTALGLDDAAFLETDYPGMKFVAGSALDLPFPDAHFDVVHSSAVLEHVGSIANQRRMIEEALRVARRGVFLTTPNRWFPIEFHTQLPLVHWLPKSAFRAFLRWKGLTELAQEKNLNLMSAGDLHEITASIAGWRIEFQGARLLGLTSNLILVAIRS